jgi:hypothetical protein
MTVTRAHLECCPSCARHVRTDEGRCPFCGAELPPGFRASPVAPSPAVRLSRAALYALGVGALSLTAAQGCGGVIAGGGEGNDGGEANCCPPYGAPPPFDAGGDGDSAAGDAGADAAGGDGGAKDTGSDVPVFPVLDAADEDTGSDARSDVWISPPYGAPPPEPLPGPREEED